MSNLKIDYDKVESIISELKSSLSGYQGDVNSAYNGLSGGFSESTGEEADALRALQQAEKGLMTDVAGVLDAFAGNIQQAVNSFQGLDRTMRSQM